MVDAGSATQLSGFLDRYDPAIAGFARSALTQLRKRLPGAVELVYDNYNALAIAFGPSERSTEAVFSIALYPRWVTLFFLQGAKLKDPAKQLRGSGAKVRHIVLRQPEDVGSAEIDRLIGAALDAAAWKPDGRRKRNLIIKSVSAKQRPRRTGSTPH